MRRLFLIVIILFTLYILWPGNGKQAENPASLSLLENIKMEILTLKDNPDFTDAIDSLTDRFNQLANILSQLKDQLSQNQGETTPPQVEKPNLTAPAEQVFSIHNIEIGDDKSAVDHELGAPERSTLNEYGTEWHTYHENYQNFLMVAFNDNSKVTGIYTNQAIIASSNGINYGSAKEDVHEQLGQPLTQIRKGLTFYQFEGKKDYDVFLESGSYITIFYDIHQDNTVTSMLIISKSLEQKKKLFYTKASDPLKVGFEYQLFDITNAERVNHRIPVLSWDDQVKETARKHSMDMARQNYFDHTNLEGESPFDRMTEDDINFTMAGENLASGQFSSIFAHEGLMNSLGHRKNILRADYEYLGVGVAFNSESQPYYTENFYSN